MFKKARQDMGSLTTDKAADSGLTKDTKVRLSQIKREECTQDARRIYQNGEISEKTGLMKTPKGWVKPPAKGGEKKAIGGEDKNLAREIENGNHFEEQQKEVAKAKREAELKRQRQEGEAAAAAFQKKVENGEIVYNEKSGKFEENEQSARTTYQMDKWLREDPAKLSDKELMEKNETLHDLAKNTTGENFKKLMNAGIGLENELAKRKLPTNPQGIGYKEAKEKSLLKPAEKAQGNNANGGSKIKPEEFEDYLYTIGPKDERLEMEFYDHSAAINWNVDDGIPLGEAIAKREKWMEDAIKSGEWSTEKCTKERQAFNDLKTQLKNKYGKIAETEKKNEVIPTSKKSTKNLPKSVTSKVRGFPSVSVGEQKKVGDNTYVTMSHPEFDFQVKVSGDVTSEKLTQAVEKWVNENKSSIKKNYPSAFEYD